MRRLSRRTKIIVGLVATLAVAVNGGAAWAYWQAKGSGTAAGTAGSVVTLEATAAPLNGALLYPGVQRNLRVTIKNTNTFPVTVTQIRRGPTGSVPDSVHAAAGCVRTGVSITNALYAVSWPVGAGKTVNFTLPSALRMTNDSDSACQGATFKLPILVTGVAQAA